MIFFKLNKAKIIGVYFIRKYYLGPFTLNIQ